MSGKKIAVVGDLHGNYAAFILNLKAAGILNANGKIQSCDHLSEVIFLGDILCDRHQDGMRILYAINKTLRPALNQRGVEVHLIAGNHEDVAISFLVGRSSRQWDFSSPEGAKNVVNHLDHCRRLSIISGLGEFGKFTGLGVLNLDQLRCRGVFESGGRLERKSVLERMKQTPLGQAVLAEITSMKLGLKRGTEDAATVFCHTDPAKNLTDYISDESGDFSSDNGVFQSALTETLLNDATWNRHNNLPLNMFLDSIHRSDSISVPSLANLRKIGIGRYVHGHSAFVQAKALETIGGVQIVRIDRQLGASSQDISPDWERSVALIDPHDLGPGGVTFPRFA